MSDVIELRGLRLSALVGVLAEERTAVQPLEIDLDFERPMAIAAAGDDLSETTNYAEVLSLVCRVVEASSYQLLETLAHRVGEDVLGFDRAITSVTVAIRKLRPPVPEPVATVGVRCTLHRSR